jgi:hypothetical protein
VCEVFGIFEMLSCQIVHGVYAKCPGRRPVPLDEKRNLGPVGQSPQCGEYGRPWVHRPGMSMLVLDQGGRLADVDLGQQKIEIGFHR